MIENENKAVIANYCGGFIIVDFDLLEVKGSNVVSEKQNAETGGIVNCAKVIYR